MGNNIKTSFLSYEPDSEIITLEYNLVDNNKHQNFNLNNYKNEYGKIINSDNFVKVETFKKTQKLIDIKKKVKELTKFPKKIMINFGYIGKKIERENIIFRYNKFDEKGKDITDSILIKKEI